MKTKPQKNSHSHQHVTFEWKIFRFQRKMETETKYISILCMLSFQDFPSRFESEIKVPWNLSLNYNARSQLLTDHEEAHFDSQVKTKTKPKRKVFQQLFSDTFSAKILFSEVEWKEFCAFLQKFSSISSFPWMTLLSLKFVFFSPWYVSRGWECEVARVAEDEFSFKITQSIMIINDLLSDR